MSFENQMTTKRKPCPGLLILGLGFFVCLILSTMNPALGGGLLLFSPTPGSTNTVNTAHVSGATPGATIHFVFGFLSGFTNVPGCPSSTGVSISDPRVIGSSGANSSGDTSFSIFVPGTLTGQTVLVQAVEQSSCTVSNLVAHTFQGMGGVVQSPLHCEGDSTLIITKQASQDLVIDGGGEDCIRAKGQCTVDIDPENIHLINCKRCIKAEDGANVTLIAPLGNISCHGREDGIKTEGHATVSLEAFGDITIHSTKDNGIKAEGMSNVTLSTSMGTCTIQGNENAIRQEGAAVVDTSGCKKLNLIGGNRSRRR